MAEEVILQPGDFGMDTNIDLLSIIEEEPKKEEKKEEKTTTVVVPPKKEEKKEEEELDPDKIFEEEEEEIKEEEEKDDEKGTPFEEISKGLVASGIFSDDEELPKTEEEFVERFKAEKQKGANEWLNDFLTSEHGEEGINLFKSIFVDKVDPREYFSVYNDALNLSELDLENEADQKKVFKEYYSRLGLASNKIDSKLEKAIEYGDLESDSKDFHEQLLRNDQVKLKEIEEKSKANQIAQLQADTEYKELISKKINEKLPLKEFDGLPLNIDTARKVTDFLTTKKYQTPDKQKLTEFDKFILETKRPENLQQRIKIALLAMSNFDLTKVEKRAITKKTSSLFSGLVTKEQKQNNSKTSAKDDFVSSL